MESINLPSILSELKHYLPHQAPLKDFVHHNSLHAFQKFGFHEALTYGAQVFGYQTYLEVSKYINLFHQKIISQETIADYFKFHQLDESFKQALFSDVIHETHPRIGSLRKLWQKKYHININKHHHQLLFRLVSNYLDQGISKWQLPSHETTFLESIRQLEKHSLVSLFKTERPKRLLKNKDTTLEDLLSLLVGDARYYKQYLFDQQFNHPGWSGMVAFLENHPHSLFESKKISLEEFIFLELLLEIDVLDNHFGKIWSPLTYNYSKPPINYTDFTVIKPKAIHDLLKHWQNIYELEIYKKYLSKIVNQPEVLTTNQKSFQAVFCIDDRMCSLRRHIETIDSSCRTFGTVGFFYVDIYYKPHGSRFNTKLCPGPIEPTVLIKEVPSEIAKKAPKSERAFDTKNKTILGGWLYTNTIGLWKSIKLLNLVFKPKNSNLTNTSIDFFNPKSELTIINQKESDKEDGLQVGFTFEQMADKAEVLLKTIDLTSDFAPIVYLISHGASSTNNTHYAGYDCGACSGRPGIVNAKVMAFICNHQAVRKLLKMRGINIPETTIFIAALHDTTLDEMIFMGIDELNQEHKTKHHHHLNTFQTALRLNILERAEKFDLVSGDDDAIEKKVKSRAYSLFEPRPELNHATNMLCVVGNRQLTYHVDLERKSFLNSYNYQSDPSGEILLSILQAITPVCGGINLEYFFSRVDNHKLGAGTKLPHNVVGLLGVSNGISGDLRVGLPSQMIEVHDPVRLLMIVEHQKDVVEVVIQKDPKLFEWFANDWVKLAVIEPTTKSVFFYENKTFNNINSLM